MKFNSISVLLNLILSFIIIFGIVLYLKQDSFDGANLQKLSKKKASLTSKQIPDNINDINISINKKNYLKKMKDIIKKQKIEISIIQNDNMQLSNDKVDLQKIIKNMKNQFKNQRDRLLEQNMKQINEAEQQHYKNISELRAKINDLQRENIKLLEKNNIEIIALKAKINILNDKLTKLKKTDKSKKSR